MYKLILGLSLFIGISVAQSTVPLTLATVDPTGNSCTTGYSPRLLPTGIVYTCQSGTVHAATAAGAPGTVTSVIIAGTANEITTTGTCTVTTTGTCTLSLPTAVLTDTIGYCADAGMSDTYACTLAPAQAAYVTGGRYRFKANTANTGAATINFNAIGAKTIVKVSGGITTALADNDILAGQVVDLVYDGTNMQMQSTLGNVSGGDITIDTTVITGGAANRVLFESATNKVSENANFTFDGSTLRYKLPTSYSMSGPLGYFLGPDESSLPAAIQGYSTGVNEITVNATDFSVIYGVYHAIHAEAGFGGVVLGVIGAGQTTGSEWDVLAVEDGDTLWGTAASVSDNGQTGLTGYDYFAYGDHFAGTGFTAYVQYFAQDVGFGNATNAYSFWADTQGVCRYKADNTFNAVYQSIPACYNPQFTKYTPGAANFERGVCQWESNVYVCTTENGGTGTLRNIQIDGAEVDLGTSSHLVNIPATSFKFAGVTCQLTTVATITGVMRCM